MPSPAGEVDAFPTAQDTPATAAVYRAVRTHITNLSNIHSLVRNFKEGDQPRITTVEEVNSHNLLAAKSTEVPHFDSHQELAPEELLASAEKARRWLFQIIHYQSHLDRGHFLRLFRSTLESDMGTWSDLQQLYYGLTKEEIGDLSQRLRIAFAISLQGNFADKYAKELERVQQAIFLKTLPHSSYTTPSILYARNIIADKAFTSIIDDFACAVPLYQLADGDEEKDCPICQKSYVDFINFTVEDLLADYPVRIKYCGHIFGKSCLERWMQTPNENPAKYPHKSCPYCRTQVSDREDIFDLPEDFVTRMQNSRYVNEVMRTTEMELEDCIVAVKRMMSEEIAVRELAQEVKKQTPREEALSGKREEGRMRVNESQGLLSRLEVENRKERMAWGIQRFAWDRARDAWVDEGKKK